MSPVARPAYVSSSGERARPARRVLAPDASTRKLRRHFQPAWLLRNAALLRLSVDRGSIGPPRSADFFLCLRPAGLTTLSGQSLRNSQSSSSNFLSVLMQPAGEFQRGRA